MISDEQLGHKVVKAVRLRYNAKSKNGKKKEKR